MVQSAGIYLERRDPHRNMARFYALEIRTDLFGCVVAVRRWGRIGSLGRQSSRVCSSVAAARDEIERRAHSKRLRRYRDR
ncbi:MAG: WGR domain-containing protein [Rhizobium sp.]|nr:WGR domain-containing protein [Rhizobium sp.]